MREIELTQGFVTLVDDEDFARCSTGNKWCLKNDNRGRSRYVYRFVLENKIRVFQSLHRFVIGIQDDKIQVDHIDRDGLNNCRSNLRLCTRSENKSNVEKYRGKYTSKHKGVSWNTRDKRWYCRISVSGKFIHLGCFKDESVAALAYNEAALNCFGQFAKLNTI